MNQPYTLFPLSLHESYRSEESLFYDDLTHFAHRLIREDFRSPYDAWMMATSRDISQLPEILGMTEAQTEEILDFPFLSPPHLNVIRFCKALGVHPAHILPYSSESYLSHSPVLQAMIEMARDKPKREVLGILDVQKIPDADYRECMDAFALERRRLKVLEYNATPQLRVVFEKMKALTKFDPQAVIDTSLCGHFKRVLGLKASDIVEVCDMYEMFLDEKKTRKQKEYHAAEKRFQDAFDALVEDGNILFGDAESKNTVVKIIGTLEGNEEYITLTPVSRNTEKGALIAEYLHPEFLQNAYITFNRPEHVVTRFSDTIDGYFNRKDISKKSMAFRDDAIREHEQFQAWRKSDGGKEELALLANYYRIRPFLPEGTDLPLGNEPPPRKLLIGYTPK